MARPKNLNDLGAGEDIYYFVNNAQGTPVLIVDSAGKSVSKINLDEWGNPGTVEGSRAEINYTGKKLDPKTGLYYFNQRYYDPEIGRFLTEDPAKQCFNPYLYSGNNPLMYVDPDGQLFGIDDALMATMFAAMFQGACVAAAVNVTMQYLSTGEVNFGQVGMAAVGGAIGAGMFNYIGGTMMNFGVDKVLAHALAGGVQSSVGGGNFLSGALGAGVAELASPMIMNGMSDSVGRIAGASLVGGLASVAGGGDFGQGAMSGGFGMAFNHLGDYPLLGKAGGTSGANNNNNQGMDPKAKAIVNTYGADALSITGGILCATPIAPVGVAMCWAGTIFGAYNTVSNWNTNSGASRIMGIIGMAPPYHAVFSITRGSASLIYNLGQNK